jgi:hypothetical protein
LVGPLVGGRSQEDHSRQAILDIAGTYQTKLGSRRAARASRECCWGRLVVRAPSFCRDVGFIQI